MDEEKREDVFAIKLNKDERLYLERLKEVIEQEKDSTAIKQLAWIGAKVILADGTMQILETIFENKRKNKRIGVQQFES